MEHKDARVAKIAARQLGVVTRHQLTEIGVSDDEIRTRVARGVWRRSRRGVFVVAGAPTTWEQTLLVAVLAGGPGAVASHLSAARLHRFPDVVTQALEVSVPPGRQPRVPGARVHRPGSLGHHDVMRVGSIPATSFARTLCDCSGRMSLGQLGRALDDGLVRRATSLRAVDRCVSAVAPGPGRKPSLLRLLLDERGPETARAESRPEARLYRLIVDAGLPAPVQQHWVDVDGERYRLDLAYPALRVAVEYDGAGRVLPRRVRDESRP